EKTNIDDQDPHYTGTHTTTRANTFINKNTHILSGPIDDTIANLVNAQQAEIYKPEHMQQPHNLSPIKTEAAIMKREHLTKYFNMFRVSCHICLCSYIKCRLFTDVLPRPSHI
ncbi:hypothetical protein, partial [Paenibacillus polymyxa]|uniref:hypothetical protein n=1 Tax=Paenibacillus polymyxa TaxID=1406 RepID=UPI001C70D9DF